MQMSKNMDAIVIIWKKIFNNQLYWFHWQLMTYLFCILGLIWSEIKQLWDVGLREYVADMWNVVDFVTNSLYVATIALRLVAYYKVR